MGVCGVEALAAGVGGERVTAWGEGEGVGGGEAVGGAGGEVGGRWVEEGLVEDGAEVGGFAEELEWSHGW